MPGTGLVKFIAYAFLILTWPAAAALGYLIGASNPLALLALLALVSFSIVSTLAFKVLRQAELYGPLEKKFEKFSDHELCGILRNPEVCQAPWLQRALRERAADRLEQQHNELLAWRAHASYYDE